MNLLIRSFELSDHAAAVELWRNMQGIGLSEADSFEEIARFLNRNPGLSYVALDSGRLVGTLLCGHDGRRGLLHHLAVREGYRRAGLGRSLLKKGLEGLRGQGITKCHLFVFRSNVEARAFWLRTGAEERDSLTVFSLQTAATVPAPG